MKDAREVYRIVTLSDNEDVRRFAMEAARFVENRVEKNLCEKSEAMSTWIDTELTFYSVFQMDTIYNMKVVTGWRRDAQDAKKKSCKSANGGNVPSEFYSNTWYQISVPMLRIANGKGEPGDESSLIVQMFNALKNLLEFKGYTFEIFANGRWIDRRGFIRLNWDFSVEEASEEVTSKRAIPQSVFNPPEKMKTAADESDKDEISIFVEEAKKIFFTEAVKNRTLGTYNADGETRVIKFCIEDLLMKVFDNEIPAGEDNYRFTRWRVGSKAGKMAPYGIFGVDWELVKRNYCFFLGVDGDGFINEHYIVGKMLEAFKTRMQMVDFRVSMDFKTNIIQVEWDGELIEVPSIFAGDNKWIPVTKETFMKTISFLEAQTRDLFGNE